MRSHYQFICLFVFFLIFNVSIQVFNSDNFLPVYLVALIHRDITLIGSKFFSLNAIKLVIVIFFCQSYENNAFDLFFILEILSIMQ